MPIKQRQKYRLGDFSPVEQRVLRGIADDKTYLEIGRELNLGYESIKTYAGRLRAKLGVRGKAGLAVWAARNGVN